MAAASTGLTNNVSTDAWAVALLKQLGDPVTPNNVNNLKLWLHQEQNAQSWATDMYNPLGVERGGLPKPFSSVEAGVQGTAAALNNGLYPQILAALKQNKPTVVFAQAVISSPWSGGAYAARGLSNWLSYGPLEASAIAAPGPGNEVSRLIGDIGLPGGGVIQDISGGVTGAAKDVVHTVGGAVSGTAKFFDDITSAAFWKRIGIFAGGAVLFGVGLAIFTSTTGPGKQASKSIITTATEAAA